MRGGGEQGGLGGVDVGDAPGRVEIGNHQGERLLRPMLAFPQHRHCGITGGVAGQVVAADPLHCQHLPVIQEMDGRGDRVVRTGRTPSLALEPQRGAAVGAGDGLGVEPSVGRVLVLGPAGGAHREAGHGGRGPVVGERGDDGEAWSAVRTGDERVPVATVGRVEQLAHAVVAQGRVRRYQGPGPVDALAGDDPELGYLDRGGCPSGGAYRGEDRRDDRLHLGQGRSLPLEPEQELVDVLRRALDLDEDSGGVVAHEAF